MNSVKELSAKNEAAIKSFDAVARALLTPLLPGDFKSPEEYKNQP